MENRKTVTTICGVCEHACGMQVETDGINIFEVKGHKEHPHSKGFLCPKGTAAKEIWASPLRLKKPLKKNGGDWEEISWEEALQLCSDRLQAIRDSYGPHGLFIYHGQTYLKSRLASFFMNRFLNLYGAVNLSSAGSECFISFMLANFATFGNLPFPDYENSKCIILWGSNPCASGGIGKSYGHMIHLLKERKKDGAYIIVIDPRKTASAELADMVIQPRPGTDGALALGVIRTILDEQLEDTEYVNDHTSGIEQLRNMIGEYPLEKIEEITGVTQQVIKELARKFASTRPGSIKAGSGIEHHTNGVQAIRAINIILALTGNIDVEGGNTFLGNAQLNPPQVNSLSTDKTLGGDEHPMFVSMINQSQAVAALGHLASDDPYPVRGFMVAGGGPKSVLANAGRVQEVMDKMEFSVVIDQFMTETAQNAHLILPAAMFLERDELSINPIILQNKVIEPDGPWPDWKIWLELARKMGYGEHFPWQTNEDALEYILEPTGYSLQKVREATGGITIPVETGKMLREGFYTYSGKIEIFSKSLESNDYDPLPNYVEPKESPVSTPKISQEYPIILITGARSPFYVHSQQRNIESLRKLAPEPLMEVHPVTASIYGIADGDEAVVESLRGSIRIKTACTEDIREGVVHVPHGMEREANCNLSY